MDLRHHVFASLTTLLLLTHALVAHAAFFQLAENSPAGLGNAFAGGAAIAEDASTVWYNPAGLTRLTGQQVVAGGHFITQSIKFSKTSATRAAALGGGTISGDNGGDAGTNALVPNFFYSQSISDQIVFGLGVNAPFGLATDYGDNWVGRYHADRSEIKTVNINPSLGYRINQDFSVGAGVNIQRLEAELTNAADFGSVCALAAVNCGGVGGADGRAKVAGSDTGLGFNLGLLWQTDAATRVGFAYRSKIKHEVTGDFTTIYPNATAAAVAANPLFSIVNSGFMANITLPDTVSLSVFHQVNPTWAIMGDVTRTNWSHLPELRIQFTGSTTQKDSVVTLNLEDSYRYALGVNYLPGGAWTYRAGVALDQTPTPSETVRTPRLPDENRTWLSLGAGYKSSNTMSIDFAYTYITLDDPKINKSAGTSTSENFLRGSLVGSYKANVNILSAQAKWVF